MSRLSGLLSLATDAVVHGTSSIERLHLETANRTFRILEAIPLVDGPSALVHQAHDAIAKVSYGSVRMVAKAVGATAGAVVDKVSE